MTIYEADTISILYNKYNDIMAKINKCMNQLYQAQNSGMSEFIATLHGPLFKDVIISIPKEYVTKYYEKELIELDNQISEIINKFEEIMIISDNDIKYGMIPTKLMEAINGKSQ